MKKMLLSLITLVFIFSSCENMTDQKTTENQDEQVVEVNDAVAIELKDFESKAGDYVGKPVQLTGTIDHVCKHGGQKMFIISEESDSRIKIVTGENMAAFNTELEGESIFVTGIVDELRIDEEYLREWEEELANNTGHEEENEARHAGEKKGEPHPEDGDHHEKDHNAELDQINNLRQQLVDSGKEYLSFFSVICMEYDVIEDDSEEGV